MIKIKPTTNSAKDKQRKGTLVPVFTKKGLGVLDKKNSLSVNAQGPTLLEDYILLEKIIHFNFMRDAFGHLKSIAVNKAGQMLMETAIVTADAGVADASNKDIFIAAVKTRQSDRKKSVRMLA